MYHAAAAGPSSDRGSVSRRRGTRKRVGTSVSADAAGLSEALTLQRRMGRRSQRGSIHINLNLSANEVCLKKKAYTHEFLKHADIHFKNFSVIYFAISVRVLVLTHAAVGYVCVFFIEADVKMNC